MTAPNTLPNDKSPADPILPRRPTYYRDSFDDVIDHYAKMSPTDKPVQWWLRQIVIELELLRKKLSESNLC